MGTIKKDTSAQREMLPATVRGAIQMNYIETANILADVSYVRQTGTSVLNCVITC